MDCRKVKVSNDGIVLDDMTVCVPGRTLFSASHLVISIKEKYGLVAPNGSGKTVWLNALVAYLQDGKGCRLGTICMVNQRLPEANISALDFVTASPTRMVQLKEELARLNEMLEEVDSKDLEATIQRLEELEEEISANSDPSSPARAKRILDSLGFTDETRVKIFDDLSGGWRMRAAIARALFIQPKVLVLDEPTNHLDLEAQRHLMELLEEYNGCLLVSSHDPTFLEGFCTSYLYINSGSIGVARNLREAVQSKVHVICKNLPHDPSPNQPLIKISDLSYAWDDTRPLFTGVNFGAWWGQVIHIQGPNGSGKSTLLRILVGDLKPSEGHVQVNPHVRIGYLDQDLSLPDDQTGVFWLKTILQRRGQRLHGVTYETISRKTLANIGLPSQAHTLPISQLSGGQRARLLLASVVANEPHVLVLDEPNNNLDYEGLLSLEEFLKSWPGTLIIVSHSLHITNILQGCTVIKL